MEKKIYMMPSIKMVKQDMVLMDGLSATMPDGNITPGGDSDGSWDDMGAKDGNILPSQKSVWD